MDSLSLSLKDYKAGLIKGWYSLPESFCPYYDVDPDLFRKHGHSGQRRDRLADALHELQLRTSRDYFSQTYPLQARTLDYSTRAFPAYRFILPEVMSEDWLAIVDWGKFQRDHVLHQPLTGYVTLALLGGSCSSRPLLLPGGMSILDLCVTNILKWDATGYIRDFLIDCGMRENDQILDPGSSIAKQVWRTFFKEAAYVAAIFHDLGYPWQYAERLHTQLNGINSPATIKNRSTEQVISQFGHRLLFHALRGYQKPDAAFPSRWIEQIKEITNFALSNTHGLPGALGFLHLNDAVRKFPNSAQSPLRLLCIEWAAVAIMMHDMNKVYWGEDRSSGVPERPFIRLNFSRDPLSALIAFADVLQEFQRPYATFGQASKAPPHNKVAIDYQIACSSTELSINGSTLTITYKMKDNNAIAVKRKSLKKDTSDYFDSQYGFLDMQSLGINNVSLCVS